VVLGRFPAEWWALILGGSSGFGLAAAHKLAAHGMNVAIVHRDRRGAMPRIEPEFEKLRGAGVVVRTWNADALDATVRDGLLGELAEMVAPDGRVRLLLHSIALGNLKPLVADRRPPSRAPARIAAALDLPEPSLRARLAEIADDCDELFPLPLEDERPPSAVLGEDDFARTIHAMGTSLLGWTTGLLARGLFAADARVVGLTSEGNEVAWRGYAAVSAAKASLEALGRSLAVELAPYGVRTNVLQPGVTDTPALRAIPGHRSLRAHARLRNPFRRLTTPEDVANLICLLATDEAAWLNGALIRVDGGEHVSGAAW
jgi:NAD(P)-dependent dehydrogenase (short-subunit alcohol dehydrogenase family)